MGAMADASPWALPAIQQEMPGVQVRRGLPTAPDASSTKDLDNLNLCGLAFSGGGIRSATFNLGVLQCLERLQLLPLVDYLSTVSGGGYIGSWYLSCFKQKLDSDQRDRAVGHLRSYSNYLAPETGFFSADTWTIVMVWLRNTLLLQAMLVSLFALLLLAPRFFEWGFVTIPAAANWIAAAVLFVLATAQIVYRLAHMSAIDHAPGAKTERGQLAQDRLQYTIVLPLLAAAACFASALWQSAQSKSELALWILPLRAGVLVAAATALAAWFSLLHYLRSLKGLLGAAATGILCGGLFAGLVHLMARWYSIPKNPANPFEPWLAGLVGAPAMLVALGLAVVLQVGLLGRAIDDSRREWWSRLGAFLAIYSIGALALAAAAFYGPLLVQVAVQDARALWVSGTVTLGGIATTLGGLMAARSQDTGAKSGGGSKELLAAAAPFVFIAGLLTLVAAGVHGVLGIYNGCSAPSYWSALECSIGPAPRSTLFLATAISAFALWLLAWRVDIDEASMNPFYRNRLVRCYLGAARAAKNLRHPNLFTGFDFADDYALADLCRDEKRKTDYDGPVPIINVTLNRTGGDNAALEERRGASFFFTPYRSGSLETGFQETGDIGKFKNGIRLGSCVATSGAAASPNMGYHTSAPVAFLMTFFNVRLGLWLARPTSGKGKQATRWGLWYLLKELFATASVDDKYIYLSDGGHFENLGVYELIRRRCRYIIACDAEQDDKLVLEGLGNLVRKARIDFNAEIEIDTSQIRQIDEAGRSRAHCAVGRIYYDGNRESAGYLIYLKASLTGDEVSDVLQYKAQHSAFPHESTGDQFFSESQFESYRALGEHIVETAFAGQVIPPDRDKLGDLMTAMQEAWAPPSQFTEGHFARHAEQLNRVWDELRKDPGLAFLDPQLFPGWAKWAEGRANLPEATYQGQRRGLYLGQQLLQLMENVYLDLHLDQESGHPDNQGWMTLFQNWANSHWLQDAYVLSRETYGARFQKFCEEKLKLPPQRTKAAGTP